MLQLDFQATGLAFDCVMAMSRSLTAKVREVIDHLRELRTALISAAATGKIDVRKDAP